MTGRILIRDLRIPGVLGVHGHERVRRQEIVVNATIVADIGPAVASDRITDAVDYERLAARIVAHVEASRDHLVERLASDLADLVLAEAGVEKVRIRVEKPEALEGAAAVGVEVDRVRAG